MQHYFPALNRIFSLSELQIQPAQSLYNFTVTYWMTTISPCPCKVYKLPYYGEGAVPFSNSIINTLNGTVFKREYCWHFPRQLMLRAINNLSEHSLQLLDAHIVSLLVSAFVNLFISCLWEVSKNLRQIYHLTSCSLNLFFL